MQKLANGQSWFFTNEALLPHAHGFIFWYIKIWPKEAIFKTIRLNIKSISVVFLKRYKIKSLYT